MFIIAGRELATMKEVFYTGRAGAGWLSPHRSEAFVYSTEGEADRKARMFARQQNYRITFWAAYAKPSDAHAAGAAAMSREMCGD